MPYRTCRFVCGDLPVNLLMDTDSTYIANEAVDILGDTQRTQDAIDQFFDMFGGLVDQAIFVYCTHKNKTPDELTDEEEQRIIERVTRSTLRRNRQNEASENYL